MTQGSAGGIAAYYDHLQRFLDLARRFGRGGGAQHSSTHRFLAAAPEEAGDPTPGPERLDHLVIDAARRAHLAANPRVLDAGCGLGGTIFRWQESFSGLYDGLTLSPEQKRRAEAEAARRGVSDACRFHLRSYQEPIPASYDAAIAIESLAHSPDPTATINNLSRALLPGGLMFIVDDMPDGDGGHMLAGFKAGWRCPVLLDGAGIHAALEAAGMSIVRDDDLTLRLRPRRLAWLKVLIATFGLARAVAPISSMRDVLDAFRGGFYLEALYRVKAMRYRLIVAQKP